MKGRGFCDDIEYALVQRLAEIGLTRNSVMPASRFDHAGPYIRPSRASTRMGSDVCGYP